MHPDLGKLEIWGAITYLVVCKYCAEAVEELKGVYPFELHQSAGEDRCSRPPPRAYGHVPKPLLQWKPAIVSHHLIHFGRLIEKKRQSFKMID